MVCLFLRCPGQLDLHSFPTRRSSDLTATGGSAGRLRRAIGDFIAVGELGAAGWASEQVLEVGGDDRMGARLNGRHMAFPRAVLSGTNNLARAVDAGVFLGGGAAFVEA